jgi:hypothetical protein
MKVTQLKKRAGYVSLIARFFSLYSFAVVGVYSG